MAALEAYQDLLRISHRDPTVIRNGTTDALLADAREINNIPDPWPTSGGGGTAGASKAEVAAIVEAAGNKTRGEVAKPRPLVGQVG